MKSDSEVLEDAIWYAEKNGYKTPPLEYEVFTRWKPYGLSHSMRTWAIGLIYSHDFAKAVFGHDLISENGYTFNAIKLWAKQVAVEYQGKLIEVNPDRPDVTFLVLPEIDYDMRSNWVTNAPDELVQPEKVVMDLTKLAGSIPIRTHRIEGADVIGGIPAWQYHLREMAIAEDPFKYLGDYVNKQLYGQ